MAEAPRARLTQTAVVGGLLLLVAGVVLAESLFRLFARNGSLGPGAFPAAAAVLLAVTAVLYLGQPAGGASELNAEAETDGRAVLITLAAMVLFVASMSALGYLLAAAAFVILEIRLCFRGGWRVALSSAVILAGSTYYLFVILVPIGLPLGIFHPFA